jgi:hypothetical protein
VHCIDIDLKSLELRIYQIRRGKITGFINVRERIFL